MKLTFATLQTGNYGGRGAEYVAKLFSGVRDNMPGWVDLRCVCFTDDPTSVPDGVEALPVPFGPPSWWQKLWLFSPGAFKRGERILYSDLDSIVTGDLRDFNCYAGKFAVLRDPFETGIVNSSLMSWEAGTLNHIWTRWDEAGRPQFDPRGDQNWIGQMCGVKPDYWHELLPGQAVSFKRDCWLAGRIPDGARVLFFHGRPRPHECQAPFVKELWNRPVDVDDAATAGIQAGRASARNSTPLESA